MQKNPKQDICNTGQKRALNLIGTYSQLGMYSNNRRFQNPGIPGQNWIDLGQAYSRKLYVCMKYEI